VSDNFITVPLTRDLEALIDAPDAHLVAGAAWHAVSSRRTFYACHRIGSRVLRMHTILTGWPLVDHVNGNGLDNRRANLRPATFAENARNRRRPKNNTSGFKGVSWNRRQGQWQSYITADGKRRHLGFHGTAETAALAYDVAARELHGAFAYLNFPGAPR
jgi:hypothetical protein